jgi:pimeloyl-ACP methyl ester carboxylesterase
LSSRLARTGAMRLTDGASARGMAHRWVDVGVHCVEAGAGPLVALLHGFPEFLYAWRRRSCRHRTLRILPAAKPPLRSDR